MAKLLGLIVFASIAFVCSGAFLYFLYLIGSVIVGGIGEM